MEGGDTLAPGLGRWGSEGGLLVAEAIAALVPLAAQIRARPQAAWSRAEALAESFGLRAPHLLPDFFEDVGRLFVRHHHTEQAARAWSAARQAERAHDLAVDPQRCGQSLLEFARVGALPQRGLSSWWSATAARLPPDEAWGCVRAVALGWVEAGLAPWSTLVRDLRRAARAAGHEPDQALDAWLSEALEAPGMARAPWGLWRELRPRLELLCARDPEARAALLGLWPEEVLRDEPRGWVELLLVCGAFEAAARWAPGAAAQQIGRLVASLGERAPEAAALVLERLAGRLRADGVALQLEVRQRFDPDLLELALSLEVPVADPEPGAALALRRWASRPNEGRASLEALSADPRFGALLRRDALPLLADVEFHRVAAGAAGLAEVRTGWLEAQLEHLRQRALPGALRALRRLEALPEEVWRVSPAQLKALGDLDATGAMAVALGRTLRGGLPDELGWPALDAMLVAHPEIERFSGAFPWLVLWGGGVARPLGPQGPGAPFVPALPEGAEVVALRHVEERTLVVFRTPDGRSHAWWSGDDAPYKCSPQGREVAPGDAVEAPGGGISQGEGALKAGAREFALRQGGRLVSDGAGVWLVERRNTRERLAGLDPDTGRRTELPPPPFLTPDHEAPPWNLSVSSLRPVPGGCQGSPSGCREGLAGWRAACDDQGRWRCEGIDGRRWDGMLLDPAALPGDLPRDLPAALVDWPGGQRRLWSMEHHTLKLWDEAGIEVLAVADTRPETGQPFAAGSRWVLPDPWWHLLRARDPEGSRALRVLDDAQVLDLVGQSAPCPEAVAHPALRAGVEGVVAEARAGVEALQALQARLDEQRAQPDLPLEPQAVVDAFFSEGLEGPLLLDAEHLPWELVGAVGALAFRAASPATSAQEREAACRALEAWARGPLAAQGEKLRAFDGYFESDAPTFPAPDEPVGAWGVTLDGNRYGLRVWQEWYPRRLRCRVIELAPDGVHKPLPGVALLEERPGGGWGTPAQIAAFLAQLQRRGPVAWTPEISEALVAPTQLSPAAATLLWLACSGGRALQRDFLPPTLRAGLGLSAADAMAALRELQRRSTEALREQVHAAAMPDDPEALWRPMGAGAGDLESPVARMGRAWASRLGPRAMVPEVTRQALDAELRHVGLDAAAMLAAALDPATLPALGRDATWGLDRAGQVRPDPDPGPEQRPFSLPVAVAVAHLIPWLHLHQPVGDPAREGAPRLAELVWERLKHPGLLFPAGHRYFRAGDEDSRRARRRFERFEGESRPLLGGPEQAEAQAVDTGALVAALLVHGGAYPFSQIAVAFRPSRLEDVGPLEDELQPPLAPWRSGLRLCRVLRSGGFAALVERTRRSPLLPGQWEADPQASVPGLVQEVARRLSLAPDAAALYLQLLALPEPTDEAIERFNGWTPARREAAASALVERGLIRVGDHARAGRRHFIGGPVLDPGAPQRPVEVARLPLYGAAVGGDGALVAPLGRLLPLKPLHVIFRDAWRRAARGPLAQEF